MSPAAIHSAGRGALPFPRSLPEFQKLFSDDAACAEYLERCRWPELFRCPSCGVGGDPFRFGATSMLLSTKFWVCSACRHVEPCQEPYELGDSEPCVHCREGEAHVVASGDVP